MKSVKNYCEAIGARDNDILYILINNLDDDAKYELFALPDYASNASDIQWVESTLIKLHKTRATEVTPLKKIDEYGVG